MDGQIKLALTYRSGKQTRTRTLSARVTRGRFRATFALPTNARSLQVRLIYAGDAFYARTTHIVTIERRR